AAQPWHPTRASQVPQPRHPTLVEPPGGHELLQAGPVVRGVDAGLGEPFGGVVLVEVALAGIADEGDDAALLAGGTHLRDDAQRRPQTGARRRPRPTADE